MLKLYHVTHDLEVASEEDGVNANHNTTFREAIRLILDSDGDLRGTVASLSQEVEDQTADRMYHKSFTADWLTHFTVTKRFSLGPGTIKAVDRQLLTQLLKFYHTTHPDARVLDRSTFIHDITNANYINNQGTFRKYMFLNGRKISPSNSLDHAPNSIVQADFDGIRYVGQIFSIITHHQPLVEKDETLLVVPWFKRLENAESAHWDQLWV